jgi:hypothetical protein
MLLISLLTACGFPTPEPTIYNLTHELTDDTTGYRLRLWHYSESMLDPPGYFLEAVESGQPAQPNAGRTIVWLDGTDALPTLTLEKGCYTLTITWVGHATRFEQRNWLLFLFYGSGVELKSGDSWTEMIAQKPVCFRFEKLTKDATVL